MALLDEAAFMREFTLCTKNEDTSDLPAEILEHRARLLFVLNELTHYKLKVSELNEAYKVLVRLLLGKYPDIAADIKPYDVIRMPYAALDILSCSRGKLTDDERLLFAFFAYVSVRVKVEDENGKIHSGIIELRSPEIIGKRLQHEISIHPERFSFLSPHPAKPFGTDKNNPVGVVSPEACREYLDKLRTNDGKPVSYARVCSLAGEGGAVIECYALSFSGGSMKIYINPHAPANTTEAPDGFTLSHGESTADTYALFHDAHGGDAIAQLELAGRLYSEGDYVHAFMWYSKAAVNGMVEAQNVLGMMYEHGEGTAKNPGEAAKWYRTAADNGSEIALNALMRLTLE